MRNFLYLAQRFSLAHKDEHGVTLIETLTALAIFGIVAVVFLSGLATSSKAVIVSQSRVTVESLAKSEMEYVKNRPYDNINNPPVYIIDPALSIPQGYSVSVAAVRLDPDGDGLGDDDGLQQVIITVRRNGDVVLTLDGYKVNR